MGEKKTRKWETLNVLTDVDSITVTKKNPFVWGNFFCGEGEN